MKHVGKHEKIALAVAGIVLVYLIYRHFSGATTSATAAGSATSSDPTANDYASLAGQEQGDVAALGNQIAGLTGQEQSDVAALQTQEQGDFGGLGAQFGSFTNALAGIQDQLTGMAGSIAAGSPLPTAAGLAPVNRGKATKHRKATQAKNAKDRAKRGQSNAKRTSPTHVHPSPNRHVAPSVHAPHPSHPAAGHNPPAHRPARHPATVAAGPLRVTQRVAAPKPKPAKRGRR